MSVESALAFYTRLAGDEAFLAQVDEAPTSEARLGLAREAGYEFTKDEFEEATRRILERDDDEVVGHAASQILLNQPRLAMRYGLVSFYSRPDSGPLPSLRL